MEASTGTPRGELGQRGRVLLRAGLALTLLSLLAYCAITLHVEPGTDSPALNASYYAVMGLTVLITAARAVAIRSERVAWLMLSLVLACDLVANLLWAGIWEDDPEAPFPSLADGIWLASYALLVVGLALLLRGRVVRPGLLIWLDGTIATLAWAAAATALVLPVIVETLPSDDLASAATLAYPIGDVFVFALVFVMFAMSGWRPGPSWLLIGAGAAVWVVGDAIYSHDYAAGTYTAGDLVDVTWPLAAVLIALAAWQRPPPRTHLPAAGWRAGLLAAIGGLVSVAVLTAGYLTDVSEVALILATAAIAGLGIRLVLAHRDNQRLLHLAHTDPLTGIGSRGKLVADAAQLRGERSPLTVAVFDLDGFKLYNDDFGHPAGDLLLQHLARRLRETLGAAGAAYRIGGDEFAVVVPAEPARAAPLLEQAREAMVERGEGFEITASMGSAECPREAPDVVSALALADERMYESKNSSRTSARTQVERALVASLEERDPDLADHTGTVKDLAVAVARRFLTEREQLDRIGRAAQLHDVGKVAIPDAILGKPAALDDEEWKLMRQHTLVGERIIASAPALAPVARLVRHSHERWDGGGYPDGLAGEEIPLGSRVIFVCDAYEAMTSHRPYTEPKSTEEAIEELRRNAGTQFDPAVVEALVAVLS